MRRNGRPDIQQNCQGGENFYVQFTKMFVIEEWVTLWALTEG